jgi:hypothetical protein
VQVTCGLELGLLLIEVYTTDELVPDTAAVVRVLHILDALKPSSSPAANAPDGAAEANSALESAAAQVGLLWLFHARISLIPPCEQQYITSSTPPSLSAISRDKVIPDTPAVARELHILDALKPSSSPDATAPDGAADPNSALESAAAQVGLPIVFFLSSLPFSVVKSSGEKHD